ncbi:predicted protein, partial [Nematostella vectensis]
LSPSLFPGPPMMITMTAHPLPLPYPRPTHDDNNDCAPYPLPYPRPTHDDNTDCVPTPSLIPGPPMMITMTAYLPPP